MDIKSKVLEFLNEINPYVDVTPECDLLDEMLDSMSVLLLISNIEAEYEVEINLTEFDVGCFKNVDSIIKYIEGLVENK